MRAAALLLAALAGCASSPPVTELLPPRGTGLAQLQVRRYDGVPPAEMLAATVTALQDLGFQITSSDAALGFVEARRGYRRTFGELQRDLWLGLGRAVVRGFAFNLTPPPEAELVNGPAALNASVSVAPHGSGSAVRVAFHRTVGKPSGEPIIIWAEEVREPEPYASFFQQLSRASPN